MSDIKVNSITDLAGTGAPDFTYGATFGGGQNKWQLKTLTTTVSTDIVISDITFPLESGKTYRMMSIFRYAMNGSFDSEMYINVSDGTNQIAQIRFDDRGSAQIQGTKEISTIFTSAGTSLTFTTVSASGNAFLYGFSSRDGTHVILEELPNHIEGVFS